MTVKSLMWLGPIEKVCFRENWLRPAQNPGAPNNILQRGDIEAEAGDLTTGVGRPEVGRVSFIGALVVKSRKPGLVQSCELLTMEGMRTRHFF